MATDSKHPDTDFQWITINFQNLESLKTLEFLNIPTGGTEMQSYVYIGRHSEPGYTDIGKIYTLAPYQGLTIPDKNGKITIYKNFEILTLLNFDCSEDDRENSSEESHASLRTMKNHQRRLARH